MLGLVLLTSNALAWNHFGYYWPPQKVPLKWWMDDDPIEDSLPDDEEVQRDIIASSWANWPEGAPCAGMDAAFQGYVQQDHIVDDDGKIDFYWEDPEDIQEAGVLGVTYPKGNDGDSQTKNGRVYYGIGNVDIAFNDLVDFGTTADIAAGICNGESSIEAVATHEIGHLWGFAHSCEQGAPCTDQDYLDATMYWSVGPCDISHVDVGVDDIASANALYGSTGSFAAITPTSGGAPLTVGFEVESESEVASVKWNWGDGEEEVGGASASHTYTTSGSFTVSATMDLASPECGTTSYTQTEIGYVLACAAPVPEDGADGYFQLSVKDGLVWQTINRTNMATYGCVDTIEWEVYEGSEVDASKLVDFDGDGEGDPIGAWAPLIQFPKEGTYTVVMNVGGPGGISAGKLTIDVVDSSGGGAACNTGGGLSALGAGLAGIAALRRRRG